MKVNIIGAGVSGLAAGCYLQMNGFETEIFEKNPVAGGLCASWKRGGYTFDGCVHWVLGSGPGSEFYKVWKELMNMKSIEFKNHEIRTEIVLKSNKDKYGRNIFTLYTNISKLEKYLLDIAPEDTKEINRLIKSMRTIQRYELPPMIEVAPTLRTLKHKIQFIKLIPLLIFMLRWRKVTNIDIAKKLTNPFLKESFESLFDEGENKMLILTLPLAAYDKNGAGYPIGGSYTFVSKLEARYISLGGKIRYNAPVKKILTENDIARGVQLNNGTISASDLVLSAADWHYTVYEALEGKYINQGIQELKDLKKLRVFYSLVLVSLGVSRRFEGYPHHLKFPLEDGFVSPDGTRYDWFEIHIYNYDPNLAPEGKTVVAVSMYTMNGDYWIDLERKDKAQYNRVKEDFAKQVIEIADKKFNGIKDNIEVTDIATPATYYRYTNNWKGSTQGWLPSDNLMAPTPVLQELPGLKNFYYSSHWAIPGGGLPIAVKAARDVSQVISMKYNKKFVVIEPD